MSLGKEASWLILVMGATGSGKSSFINAIIGKEVATVGHGLESQTTRVDQYTCYTLPHGTQVRLIDTPGFDEQREDEDARISELKILQETAEFLQDETDRGQKLSGIIYLHNISTEVPCSMSRTNMHIFEKICGYTSTKNVWVVTTFWDLADPEEGPSTEEQLRTEGLLKNLFDGGGCLARTGVFSDDCTPPEGIEFCAPKEIVQNLLSLNQAFVEMKVELAVDDASPPDIPTPSAELVDDEIRQPKHENNTSIDALPRDIEITSVESEAGEIHGETLQTEKVVESPKDQPYKLEALQKTMLNKFAEWELKQNKVATKEELEQCQIVNRSEIASIHRHAEESMKANADLRALMVKRDAEMAAALEKIEKERDLLSAECKEMRGGFQNLRSEFQERYDDLSSQIQQAAKVKKVEAELSQTRDQLLQTKNQLLQTKDQLIQLRDQLSQSNNDLYQAQTRLRDEQREKEALKAQVESLLSNSKAHKGRAVDVGQKQTPIANWVPAPPPPPLPLGARPPMPPPPATFHSRPRLELNTATGEYRPTDGSWLMISPVKDGRTLLSAPPASSLPNPTGSMFPYPTREHGPPPVPPKSEHMRILFGDPVTAQLASTGI